MNREIGLVLGGGLHCETNKTLNVSIVSKLADHFESFANLDIKDLEIYYSFLSAYFKHRSPSKSEATKALGKSADFRNRHVAEAIAAAAKDQADCLNMIVQTALEWMATEDCKHIKSAGITLFASLESTYNNELIEVCFSDKDDQRTVLFIQVQESLQ